MREASWLFVGNGAVLGLASPLVPQIHAVGRAAAEGREPRLLDLTWTPAGFTGELPKVGTAGRRWTGVLTILCWWCPRGYVGEHVDRFPAHGRMTYRALRASPKRYAVGHGVQYRTCRWDHHALVL